jgi:hypothetical protein
VSAARDRERLAAHVEARVMRENAQATLDATVRRAHEAGASAAEIARGCGIPKTTVATSLKRQGLAPNVATKLRAKGTRHGRATR